MTMNVGTIDRIFRAVLGIALLYLAFGSGFAVFDAAVFKGGAAVLAVVMLAVSAMRVCPIYSIFGIKTCRT